MSKIIIEEIPFKRSEVTISFITHKKWKALAIKERITFKRLTLLALLYYGNKKPAFDLEKFKESLPNPLATTTKKCKVCYPVEVEEYFLTLAKKYKLTVHSILYFYINAYVEWQYYLN